MPVTRFNPFSNDDAESSQSMQTEEVHPDEVRVYPTPRIVDAAVNSSLQDMQVDDSTANALRSALINDPLSTVSESYYHGVAARTMKPSNYLSQKKRLTIPYTLTEQQVSSLTAYAVDFDLRFVASEPHDHPQAAACRSVDRMLVNSRIPPNATVSDVGASLVPLVLSGELAKKVHACSPLVDKKDPARNKLAMMRMNMISKSQEYSDRVRASAKLVLEKNPLAVCDRRVQECMHKSTAITSIHVYDVPIEHWGRIMEQKGANLLEGCILFPADIYNKSSGTMEAAGARYEVDALSNKFRMGFVGSPAWWYEHSLSEYMRYGIDQVILGKNYRFAYKIVERRGDTIFFRILKTEARMEPNARQCFKMPGVQMVTVNGFPVDQGRPHVDTIRRRKYSFPRNLWEDMLMHAKEMVERNTLSHERLYNYYRTVSPRQSINSVIVTGGSSVEDISQLLPLICHVALFALKEVAQSKMDTSHLINAEMERRSKATETTVYKAARAFVEALEYSLKLVFAPLAFIKDKLDKGVTHCLLRNTFSWDIQPVVHYVPVKLLLYNCYATDSSAVCDEQPYLDGGCMQDEMADLVETAQGSSDIANLLLEALGDELDSAQVQSLTAATLVDTPSETAVPTQGDTASAPTVSNTHANTHVSPDSSCRLVDAQEVERRKLSIMEAIGECEAEEQKVTAACASQVQDLSLVVPLNGSAKDITNPNLTQMLKYTELYSNPDFWYVRQGRIDKSLRGLDPQGFPYACVYTRAEYEGTFLRPVSEHYYEGMSEGRYVERTYYMVPGEYTGWVYTNDALMIQNGRAISRALRAALDKPLTFEVRLMQGPPGCGKTTSIVNSCLPTDIVLVPVRKAARETADRLKAKSAAFADMVKTRVRTVDSYLVNCLSSKMISNLATDRLMADEAFMTREGRWLAAAALLGAAEIHAYGDKMQIPHAPRASCAKDHVTLQYQHMEETFLSYRCPPEAVACFKAYYGDKIRSASVVQGDIRHLTTASGLSIPKNCVMMGMYQSDKKELQRLYGSCGVPIKIMTVHESQGNTYKDVWLHRFDKRVRTDRLSLYDQNSYVDVAMSRCTHSFYYIAPDNMRDVVTEWIRVGKDPRRIKAAADVSSAGEVLEVL